MEPNTPHAMCSTTFCDHDFSKCPSRNGLHKRAIEADIWNLSFSSNNFTRNQGTHRVGRYALKLPVSRCDKGSWNNRPLLRHHSTMMKPSQSLPHKEQKDWEHHTCPGNNYVYRRSSGWFVCPTPNAAHTCFETVNKYGQDVLLLCFRRSLLSSLSAGVSPVSHVCRTIASSLHAIVKSLSQGSLSDTAEGARATRERDGVGDRGHGCSRAPGQSGVGS